MRMGGWIAAVLVLAPVLGAWPSPARAECSVTIGAVLELTGAAGAYGQAAAKAVELALADLNATRGGACRLDLDARDSQSDPTVAVDAANQLVRLRHVPVLIGGTSSATTLPMLTTVTGPAHVVQISPAASSPRLTELGRSGRSGRFFYRTVTSDALQGVAAAGFARERGLGRIAIIHVNNDFGTELAREFARAYRALGGTVVATTPYNERQGSYAAEVTRTLAAQPESLYLVSTPVDGAAIARAWIAQGGTRRLLLNDGMNSADFIKGVGARYLGEAWGTSSGTVRSPSGDYFARAFRERSGLDPGSPAADRAYDAAALAGLALAAASDTRAESLAAGLRRVTDPKGTTVHAGAEEFGRARAVLARGGTVRYEGVIGPVVFDRNGDITGPFRLWRIAGGAVEVVGETSPEAVAALIGRIGVAP
ncbi:MAG: ABC transporter substrate-binding protein [Proteobacteria bacterium]|nr:ABC transporter substrate-binding protein [Pseudomonadota bacterium]